MNKEKLNTKIKILMWITIGIVVLLCGAIIARVIINNLANSYINQGMGYEEVVKAYSNLALTLDICNALFIITTVLSIIILLFTLVIKSNSKLDKIWNKRITIINLLLLIINAAVLLFIG